MGKYLSKKLDTDRDIEERSLTALDLDLWMNLLDGARPGQVAVQADALGIIDMDYFGSAEAGYLSTHAQTGCTVIIALQHVGGQGRWAYFNHVRSSEIDAALAHACHCAYQRANADDILFVIMGGPGGSSTYKELLRRIKVLGDRWRFMVLTKPENRTEESVLHVDTCRLALTQGLVSAAHHARKQRPGFHQEKVPSEAPQRAAVITGHKDFDEAIKDADTREAMWISLCVECGRLPEGMPREGDIDAGVEWITQEKNLETVLAYLSKQSSYLGLNVALATPRLLRHVQGLPIQQ